MLLTAPTYTWLNSELMEDISNVVTEVGTWVSTNPMVKLGLTLFIIGASINFIRMIINMVKR